MECVNVKINDNVQFKLEVRSQGPSPSAPVEIADDSTGLDIWPSACLLARLCFEKKALIRRAKCVLELGCGMGLVGITAALLRKGREVVLTDSEQGTLNLAQRNAKMNKVEVTTAAIDFKNPRVPAVWEKSDDKPVMWAGVKIVLASDVVYSSLLAKPLVETIGLLRSHAHGAEVVVLLSNQVIKTVSFNERREPVTADDDTVLNEVLDLAKADGWHRHDFRDISTDNERVVGLCTSQELLEELTAPEDDTGPTPGHLGEAHATAHEAPPVPDPKRPRLG